MKCTRGFTLLEMLVVIGIISIVTVTVSTTYMTVRKTGDANRAGVITATLLKEAVRKSEVMEYDSGWGVKISGTNAILFSGTSYALRTVARDVTYAIPAGLTVSGPSEIVFAKFSGQPGTTGTTTFANGFGTSSVYVWNGGIIGN
ncbi:MAG: type II secretion system protein [Patescibacteria group bacterium]